MLRACRVIRGPNASSGDHVDTVLLDHEARQRRRIKMTGEGGLAFLLDLERPASLADGDGLVLEDGRIVRVIVAPEEVVDILPGPRISLAHLAWHLGNRHCPTEVLADRLRIRRDHVLIEMLRGLGAETELVTAPFRPESGAYGQASAHHDEH